jgi:hypothetical protein
MQIKILYKNKSKKKTSKKTAKNQLRCALVQKRIFNPLDYTFTKSSHHFESIKRPANPLNATKKLLPRLHFLEFYKKKKLNFLRSHLNSSESIHTRSITPNNQTSYSALAKNLSLQTLKGSSIKNAAKNQPSPSSSYKKHRARFKFITV